MKSSFTGIFMNALGAPKESFHDKFLTRFYTEQEGEFYDLGYDEALSSHHEGARRIPGGRSEIARLCGPGMAAQQGS